MDEKPRKRQKQAYTILKNLPCTCTEVQLCSNCLNNKICYHIEDEPRLKRSCFECNPKAFCFCAGPNMWPKSIQCCSICYPQGYCNHGMNDTKISKRYCRQCSPQNFCQHGISGKTRSKSNCTICSPEHRCRAFKISGCTTRSNKKYNGYCAHCFKNLHPDDPLVISMRKLSHETKWTNALMNSSPLSPLKWSTDCPIELESAEGGCPSRRRVDMWTILSDVIVCIEIDENQHRYYPEKDEESRYNEIVLTSTEYRYLFFRINPDSYRSKGKLLKTSFEQRLEIAIEAIAESLKNLDILFQDKKPLHVEYLFYDDEPRPRNESKESDERDFPVEDLADEVASNV